MPLEPLRLTNIQAGELVDQVNAALDRLTADVLDRYDVEKSRTVQIEIAITPEVHKQGGERLVMPEIDWKVTTKVPGIKGATTTGAIKTHGGRQVLMVNTDAPFDSPDQRTIYDEEREAAKD